MSNNKKSKRNKIYDVAESYSEYYDFQQEPEEKDDFDDYCGPIFNQINDNYGIDYGGNLQMRIGDNLSVNLSTGHVNLTYGWGEDWLFNTSGAYYFPKRERKGSTVHIL